MSAIIDSESSTAAAIDFSELDRSSVLHPSTSIRDFATGKAPSTLVNTASGVRVRLNEGGQERELIDSFAGLYCVNIGYGRHRSGRSHCPPGA
jgi:L-2,4-diaminobutyrate transaminase